MKILKNLPSSDAYWVIKIQSMKSLILPMLSLLLSGYQQPAATLKIEITNVKSGHGKLWFAVFRPGEKFGEGQPSIYKILEVKSTANHAATFQLAPGQYALAVYHDLNKNDLLDKNFIGIPKEPYGFSNNFRPKFSPPKFEDCAFELTASGKQISVKLTN